MEREISGNLRLENELLALKQKFEIGRTSKMGDIETGSAGKEHFILLLFIECDINFPRLEEFLKFEKIKEIPTDILLKGQ